MAVMTTAGLDKIDTDLVKKERRGGGEAQVGRVIFQQANNYLCDHVSHK